MIARLIAGSKRIFGMYRPRRDLHIWPDDVFLVSFPKSGNTWTRFLIANLAYPNDQVDFASIHRFVPDPYVTWKRDFDRMPRPRIIKSHECFEPRYPRAMYIVRDPRDVVISQYHYHRKCKKIEDGYPMEKFVTRFLAGDTCPHGSWGESVTTWLTSRHNDPRFLLLRYEDLVADPRRELARVATFLNIPPDADRIATLEENQETLNDRINEQSQTKVESGSKYRLRLSGMVLLNLYDNRGSVDNQDFPQIAAPARIEPFHVSSSAFGGTLRQSQIKLQTFGPDIAGARTSADLEFDFAGGFANTWNGAALGLVRLRTGTIRLDWANTSIIAGQDRLFFAPLAPTSLATLATPALSYAGDLWGWTPQVRVEHHFRLSDVSNVVLQAGILDSLSGDMPESGIYRTPSWGEQSGQPAYATRISWNHRVFGRNFTMGVGGYYGRQDWGLNRTVDGWAGTADVTLPLGKLFEFTGAFYRGRAVAGLGGGIGQSVLLNGSFIAPATAFRALDSMGGWAQLKIKPRANFEINAALGLDNPFAGELRQYASRTIYPNIYVRNLSPLINFIYQIRSDILFSTEYRHLQTSVLDGGSNSANHVNLSLGYIF